MTERDVYPLSLHVQQKLTTLRELTGARFAPGWHPQDDSSEDWTHALVSLLERIDEQLAHFNRLAKRDVMVALYGTDLVEDDQAARHAAQPAATGCDEVRARGVALNEPAPYVLAHRTAARRPVRHFMVPYVFADVGADGKVDLFLPLSLRERINAVAGAQKPLADEVLRMVSEWICAGMALEPTQTLLVKDLEDGGRDEDD